MTSRDLILFVRLSRPAYLLAGIMLYSLGAGIARYLGVPIDWGVFWLGLAWVFSLQLGGHYLNDYFLDKADQKAGYRSPFSGGSGSLGPGKLPRQVALGAALFALTVTTSLTVLMIRGALFAPPTMVVLVILVLGVVFYATPQGQAAASGYRELLVSILAANMVPSFAFLLQTGELHRLLAMTTFPLTALHLAMLIAFGLADFARDVKYEKPSLLVRMGWREGMLLHNLLILSAYLLIGLAATLGLPLLIALPALLPLPLGVLQIWQMSRIAAGARPSWRALHLTAAALFGATAYLLTYGFWTR